MQRNLDKIDGSSAWLGHVGRSSRALLPFLLLPCIPSIVACNTAAKLTDTNAEITPEVVARLGPPPLLLRPLAKGDAIALNRRIPFSVEPLAPAAPFVAIKDKVARARALECLTSAIYYEAATESAGGQQAVAQVILNRARHPAFPNSVCGVIYQGATRSTGCQFSFTCDGSLLRVPSRREWERARAVAESSLAGAVYAPVGLATHYHADYVVPYWAPSLAKSKQVDTHIFYRWAGSWGRLPSFTQRYAGDERDPVALRNVALLSHGVWPRAELPAKPRLTLTIDREVELGGIVRILAAAPGVAANPFEPTIRGFFQGATAKPLLELLTPAKVEAPVARPADAEAVDLEVVVEEAAPAKSLAETVRDFMRSADLRSFLRSHRAAYRRAMTEAQARAEQSAVDWETYTGAVIPARKTVFSLTQGRDVQACPALEIAAPAADVLSWPDAGRSPAQMFLASGFAEAGLAAPARMSARAAKRLRASLAPVRDQVVAAVFARIAALSSGAKAGDAAVRAEIAAGNILVPTLVERLRFFEAHRGEYATLDSFLPTLLAHLPLPVEKKQAAVIDSPSPCNVAAVVPPSIKGRVD